ncbi:MAG: TadE family protein [Ilumatobacteraceae bacterium]
METGALVEDSSSASERSDSAGRIDRGAALVEFALVVMPLILIVLAIVQFGLVLNAQISIQSAAREGARELALRGPNWRQAVEGALAISEPIEVTSGPPCPTTRPSSPVYARVEVTTEYEVNLLFKTVTVPLRADAAMRCGL